MDGRTGSDSDRLPWLEPYREPRTVSAPRPSAPARSVKVPVWLLGVLGAGALAVGGYWVGRSDSLPGSSVTAPLPPASQPASSSPASPLAYPPVDALADPPPPPPVSQLAPARAASPPVVKRRAAASHRTAHRPRAVARHHHQAKAKPKPPPRPRFVLRMSPPPIAGKPGQVIELGRFVTARAADAKWTNAVWRYPYLGRLSKTVVPTSFGTHRRVYALRLGAQSRRNAKILCRNLISIGYPCAVV